MDDDLCFTPAVELARRLHARELSARELLAAFLDRIHRVNPALNAIVTLVEDQATRQAAEADETAARGVPLGPLHGLPIAVKDLADTAGIRTTYGSPLFADHVPDRDAPHVESAAYARREQWGRRGRGRRGPAPLRGRVGPRGQRPESGGHVLALRPAHDAGVHRVERSGARRRVRPAFSRGTHRPLGGGRGAAAVRSAGT